MTPLDEGLLAAYSDGFVVLQNRKVRGVPVDRIVVGPSGIFVIDAGNGTDDAEEVEMLAAWVGETVAACGIPGLRSFGVQPVLWSEDPQPNMRGVPTMEPKALSKVIFGRKRELTNEQATEVARVLLTHLPAAA